MAWTAPYNFTDAETITAAILNTYVSDNLSYLYDNLPTRAAWFYSAHGSMTGNVLATQPYNCTFNLTTGTEDGETTSHSFVLAAGTYSLKILGQTRTDSGLVDWTLDGATIATGQDWYSAVDTANVTQTVTGVVIETGGRHILTGTVNGKNGSSTGYSLYLTRLALLPAADS